jgi:hypothetical protein
MRSTVNYWDLNAGVGWNVYPNGMAVLGGDVPAWQLCNAFHKAITSGAAVVAVGPGTEVSESRKDYIVAYSTDAKFQIGKPIHMDMKDGDDLGPLPEF